jgi:hypothetical protein
MFNGKNIREYGIIAKIYTGCSGIMGGKSKIFYVGFNFKEKLNDEN